VNTASEDFPGHLAALRQRAEHPTAYEQAVTYFLEEFAGDLEFIRQSNSEEAPGLLAILNRVVGQMLPGRPRLERAVFFRLEGHPFIHGNALVEQHALVFFLFLETDTGVAALIPGVNGAMEVARFTLPGGMPRPELN